MLYNLQFCIANTSQKANCTHMLVIVSDLTVDFLLMIADFKLAYMHVTKMYGVIFFSEKKRNMNSAKFVQTSKQ